MWIREKGVREANGRRKGEGQMGGEGGSEMGEEKKKKKGGDGGKPGSRKTRGKWLRQLTEAMAEAIASGNCLSQLAEPMPEAMAEPMPEAIASGKSQKQMAATPENPCPGKPVGIG